MADATPLDLGIRPQSQSRGQRSQSRIERSSNGSADERQRLVGRPADEGTGREQVDCHRQVARDLLAFTSHTRRFHGADPPREPQPDG